MVFLKDVLMVDATKYDVVESRSANFSGLSARGDHLEYTETPYEQYHMIVKKGQKGNVPYPMVFPVSSLYASM